MFHSKSACDAMHGVVIINILTRCKRTFDWVIILYELDENNIIKNSKIFHQQSYEQQSSNDT